MNYRATLAYSVSLFLAFLVVHIVINKGLRVNVSVNYVYSGPPADYYSVPSYSYSWWHPPLAPIVKPEKKLIPEGADSFLKKYGGGAARPIPPEAKKALFPYTN